MKHIKFTLLIAIILSACSSSSSTTPEETLAVEPSPIPAFTSTPQPTNSPEPSPTATIDYQSLTDEEKLAHSQFFMEQANTYDGKVEVKVTINGTTYTIYWSPTRNGYRSDHNTPESELDIYGESFPDLTIAGRENLDHTLTMIHPTTGKETTFANPILPGKGEITWRELYNLSQKELGSYLIDDIVVPSLDPTNETEIQVAQAMKKNAVFLPGVICNPQQNNFYAGLGGGGTQNNDLPEENKTILERPTNQFCIPIYSPETGDFMFFVNIQQATHSFGLFFEYSPDGTVKAFQLGHLDNKNFGADGKDQFGALIENRDWNISHWGSDLTPLLQENEGIGSITDVEKILNARTEKEILKILKELQLIVSYPKRIVAPKN